MYGYFCWICGERGPDCWGLVCNLRPVQNFNKLWLLCARRDLENYLQSMVGFGAVIVRSGLEMYGCGWKTPWEEANALRGSKQMKWKSQGETTTMEIFLTI